jgi:predicted HicB family RNase H-like nuclease
MECQSMARKIVAKPKSATSKMFSVRFEPGDRQALAAAAKAEDRPEAYIVRRATIEWLKGQGFLK